MQKTIAKEISLEGIGLHTGKQTHLRFIPRDTNQGITFKRKDLPPGKIVSVGDFEFGLHQRRTSIAKDGVEIHTVEHLMAALWALSIDNIMIETDSPELPGLDGSAKGYYDCLKTAGIKEQSGARKSLKIKEPVWYEKGEAFVGIFPGSGFKVSYILESPSPSIGVQSVSLELNGENFYKEIATARTFCLKEEAEMLLKMGFGKGADTKNTLVMDQNGPIDNILRFPDEPARHKILDLVGDLYLVGCPVEGRVIAIRSGHDLNIELVKMLKSKGCI